LLAIERVNLVKVHGILKRLIDSDFLLLDEHLGIFDYLVGLEYLFILFCLFILFLVHLFLYFIIKTY